MTKHAFSVKSLAPLNQTVTQLILEPKQSSGISFIPGQYLKIQLTDSVLLPYSIACAPNTEQSLEFHIRVGEPGSYSQQIVELAKQNQDLLLEGPFGQCLLNPNSKAPLLLIAGGTGFSQMKAFIEQLIATNSQREVQLFWGLKTAKHRYMTEQLSHWQQQLASFQHTFVYSEEKHQELLIPTGFVHEYVTQHVSNLADYEAYVSGPKPMVEATKTALIQSGLKRESLFSDL